MEPSARQWCRGAMVERSPTSSTLQTAVGLQLSKLEIGWEQEVVEPTTGYALDLALAPKQLAVEVDGPSHFLLPVGPDGVCPPNGSTQIKRRLLTRANWRVVTVPYYEWDRLGSAEAQQQYLREALGM
jgi:hypothetical protein